MSITRIKGSELVAVVFFTFKAVVVISFRIPVQRGGVLCAQNTAGFIVVKCT